MEQKTNIVLTPRLLAIASQVAPGAAFADIGTDHAHLPVWLLQNGRIQWAAASDIRRGPLARARETAARYGWLDAISLRLGAGLEPISPQECDTIAIAGMGGETIADILAAAPWTAEGSHLLLLQPMTMAARLRQWLWANGYAIAKETLCREEHRHYTILTVRGGAAKQNIPLAECCLSPALLRADGAKEYLSHLLQRELRALHRLQQAQKQDFIRLAEQQLTINTLKHGLEELL